MNVLEKLESDLRYRCTPQTRKRYMERAREFIAFLQARDKNVRTFTKNDTLAFIKRKSHKCKKTSLRAIAHQLNFFCHSWNRPDAKIDTKRELPKIDEDDEENIRRVFYTEEEGNIILSRVIKYFLEKKINHQDALIMLMSIQGGPRRIQIHKTNINHWNEEKQEIKIPFAKHGRSIICKTPGTFNTIIKIHIESIADKAVEDELGKPMFIGKDGRRLSPENLSYRFNKTLKKIEKPGENLKKKFGGFHGMRRRKATALIKSGKFDDYEINKLMGWKEKSRMAGVYRVFDTKEEKNLYEEAARVDPVFRILEHNNPATPVLNPQNFSLFTCHPPNGVCPIGLKKPSANCLKIGCQYLDR